jgi:aerobic C4-dicarboxylate transport protein
VLIMMLTSKDTAAVSGGSFVVLAATVTSGHALPVEGLPAIFGIYRILSIGIAMSNVVGNAVATVVIAKWCGEFDVAQARAISDGRSALPETISTVG